MHFLIGCRNNIKIDVHRGCSTNINWIYFLINGLSEGLALPNPELESEFGLRCSNHGIIHKNVM